MATRTTKSTNSSKPYRELQAELDTVLGEMQTAELDIDKALELYKQGQKLIAQLEDYLIKAKNEIEELKH